MHGSPALPASLLYGFLLVLARVSGIFVFIPLPTFKNGPSAAKIVLALALTFALYPLWPKVEPVPATIVQVSGWIFVEAAIGLAAGLAVAFIIEGIYVAAQAISIQAGFSYAAMVDPNTEADSTVLIVVGQLTAGLLFFALGLDRRLLEILAHSLQTHPPGSLPLSRSGVETVAMLGSSAFSTGLRLVLPAMILMFLIDLSIGLLGRLNSQLQLVALAFPIKMVASLAALSFLILLVPKIYQQSAGVALGALAKVLGF
ncbi:MAG TPA: flagellar biosynthetic protein FliR [Bryobacteraceae bacterium]|nr:flagellar biosynthetic protein FliR [Bryobacteraceae bacterium]